MFRSLVFLLSLVTAVPLCAFSRMQEFRPATPAEIAMTSVAYAPGASAAILDWVQVDDDTRSTSTEYYRIKVFAEDGKKHADVEVPYLSGFPFSGKVTDISARTLQPDGTIVPFDGKIYDKVIFKSGGVRLRAKAFTLAGVKPGSILEYRYERRWTPTLLLNTVWTVQREIPLLRMHLTLRPYTDGDFGSFFTSFNLPEGKIPQKVKKGVYELELTNMPAWQAEAFAPPEEQLKSRVNFYYIAPGLDADNFWYEQTQSWLRDAEAFIGSERSLRAKAQPLTGSDELETLKNIYAKVQSFENLSFNDDTEPKDQRSAADVVAKSRGYRNELTRTLVGLARVAGLDATLMRVASRNAGFFSAKVLDGDQMSAEIAVVVAGGQTWYLDPGTPTAPFGMVAWEKSNTPGFRLVKLRRGEKPEIVMVPALKPEDGLAQRKADLRLEGDVLEGTVTATYTGQEALTRRLRSWGEDDTARTKAFEEEAKRWFPDGATVKMSSVTGATSYTEPLVARFDVTLPNVVSAAGSRTLLPASVFEVAARNPFSSATRTHAIYYEHPLREEDEVTVMLPESVALAEVPAPAVLNGGALQYANSVKQNGRSITFTRTHSVDIMLVEQARYGALRNFYSAMLSADQKPLVLVTR